MTEATTKDERPRTRIRLESWELPPMMPRNLDGITTVGVPLPLNPIEEEFSDAWYDWDPKNWELDELNRREWETEILSNFVHWKRYLDHDSTPLFKRTIKQKRAKGGVLVGVRGIKGGGKSRLSQMVIERVAKVRPHVIFQYKDLGSQVEKIKGDDEIGIMIDEDLTATGSDSGNLVTHVANSWDTGRKAIQSGVCTGVNLSFERWGNTLDLRLEPCGINYDFMATRFAMFSSKNRFLGFGALQFKHLPEDLVYYYDKPGTWADYDKRAALFSRTITRSGGAVDAIDDLTQDNHIGRMKIELKKRYVDKDLEFPPDVACRRIYRKAKLPAKSIGYMNEVIWWAKDELADLVAKKSRTFIAKATSGWDGLRTDLKKLIMSLKVKKKTAGYLADWYVGTGKTQKQIGEKYNVSRDTITNTISRYANIFDKSQTNLAKISERWLALHMETTGARVGTGGKESCDIIGRHGKIDFAINVKWALTEPKYRRHFDSTPENHYRYSYLAIINSINNTIRVYKIDGAQTYAHHNKGVPCAPEEIEEILKEMIED